ETKIKLEKADKKERYFFNGSQKISEGAIKSGLDIYYAYPMTPATSLLTELANSEGEHLTIELENEISVANAGVGSSIVGKKTMVGTSGGGFDLMTETLSLCGQAEIPLVFYLSMRPGPGTGVATYTMQGDLQMALNSGHGEFFRIVLIPGTPEEALELTSQTFYFSQKYKIPSIIISDKHLSESFYTLEEEGEIIKGKEKTILSRYNSYENDEQGIATENPEIIKQNFEKRIEKQKEIEKEAENFKMFKIYGNENSKNLIVSCGSTKGAIIDAIKDLDICFLQVLYLSPFSEKIKDKISGKNLILVENNSTGQLGKLIMEKTGIEIKEQNKILRYDGRPFLSDELKNEIERRME
ncbi:MAG: pyruvate ferredoxin oxidoreductase, partial [Phycisphaerae bacterium]